MSVDLNSSGTCSLDSACAIFALILAIRALARACTGHFDFATSRLIISKIFWRFPSASAKPNSHVTHAIVWSKGSSNVVEFTVHSLQGGLFFGILCDTDTSDIPKSSDVFGVVVPS